MSHSRAVVCDTPASAPQRAEIDQLAHPPRTKPDETPKVRQVTDLPDLAYVALNIGLEVVPQRLGGVEALINDAGIKARVEDIIHYSARVDLPSFAERKGQQAKQRRPASQRLVDGIREAELLAAGKYEQAIATSLVRNHLKV